MRAFWGRMMQVNARAVLGGMIPLCLLWIVVGLVLVGRTPTGMSLRPVEPVTLGPDGDLFGEEQRIPAVKKPGAPGLFSSRFLLAELASQAEAKALRELEKNRQRQEEAAKVVVPPEQPPTAPPVETEPAAPPVPVQYLGMMRTASNKVVALIHVGDPAVVHKLEAGGKVGPLEVIAIGGRSIELRYRGETVALNRGGTLLMEPVE